MHRERPMPRPLPNLDTRQFSDLVDEERALIPRESHKWTEYNLSDPGITLVEFKAWLSEIAIYRLNRIPDSHRRKFLSLLGFWPWPLQAAKTLLSFKSESLPGSFHIPAGVQFEGTYPEGNIIPFRTLSLLLIHPH